MEMAYIQAENLKMCIRDSGICIQCALSFFIRSAKDFVHMLFNSEGAPILEYPGYAIMTVSYTHLILGTTQNPIIITTDMTTQFR